MKHAIASVYALPDGATIERIVRRSGVATWAVRLHGQCLNKFGAWEHEPIPIARNDDFLTRCRWETAADAYSAWEMASAIPSANGVIV